MINISEKVNGIYLYTDENNQRVSLGDFPGVSQAIVDAFIENLPDIDTSPALNSYISGSNFGQMKYRKKIKAIFKSVKDNL